MKPRNVYSQISKLPIYLLMIPVIWTIVIAASLLWNILTINKNITNAARIQARMAYDKDILYRHWNSEYGGVYVPVSDETQPNPYLAFLPERDITTPSGRKLTLMNPAYMTRKIHELEKQSNGVLGHLTSHDPLRSENKADEWETVALNSFEKGTAEVSSVEKINGNPYLRLMKPLVTEKVCLPCHSQQGYLEGDIRGGISVSIPMGPFYNISDSFKINVAMMHIFVWLFGMIGIALTLIRVSKEKQRSDQAEMEQQFAIKQWQATFDAMSESISLIDPDGIVRLFNKATSIILEKSSKDIIGKTCWEVVHGTKEPIAECPYLLMKKTKRTESSIIQVGDSWVEVTVDPILDKENNISRAVHIIKDITAQKKSAEELFRHRDHLEEMVKDRTLELEKRNLQLEISNEELGNKNVELEHFNKLFVEREFRIKDLRNEIKELKDKLK